LAYYIELVGQITILNDKEGGVFTRYLPAQYARPIVLSKEFLKFLGLPEEKPEALSVDEQEMIQQEQEVKQQEQTREQEFKKDLRANVSEGQVSKQEFEQIAKQKVSDEEFAPPKGFKRVRK